MVTTNPPPIRSSAITLTFFSHHKISKENLAKELEKPSMQEALAVHYVDHCAAHDRNTQALNTRRAARGEPPIVQRFDPLVVAGVSDQVNANLDKHVRRLRKAAEAAETPTEEKKPDDEKKDGEEKSDVDQAIENLWKTYCESKAKNAPDDDTENEPAPDPKEDPVACLGRLSIGCARIQLRKRGSVASGLTGRDRVAAAFNTQLKHKAATAAKISAPTVSATTTRTPGSFQSLAAIHAHFEPKLKAASEAAKAAAAKGKIPASMTGETRRIEREWADAVRNFRGTK